MPVHTVNTREKNCSICLDLLVSTHYLNGRYKVTTQAQSIACPKVCFHLFHEKCIVEWAKNGSKCPNCNSKGLKTNLVKFDPFAPRYEQYLNREIQDQELRPVAPFQTIAIPHVNVPPPRMHFEYIDLQNLLPAEDREELFREIGDLFYHQDRVFINIPPRDPPAAHVPFTPEDEEMLRTLGNMFRNDRRQREMERSFRINRDWAPPPPRFEHRPFNPPNLDFERENFEARFRQHHDYHYPKDRSPIPIFICLFVCLVTTYMIKKKQKALAKQYTYTYIPPTSYYHPTFRFTP